MKTPQLNVNGTHHYWVLAALVGAIILSSCSARKTPAPVSEIYQGNTFSDYQAKDYKHDQYVVKKGDTLFAIAWYSGNDYRELAKINQIKAPYSIYPGQILSLKSQIVTKSKASKNRPGQTTQTIINQDVDQPKKQAYGESDQNVTKNKNVRLTGNFPNQVKNWNWPTSKQVFRGFSNKENGNKGLDFTGELGTPILAAADGKVVYTGNALRGFGNLVIIKHSDAYLSAYAHNSKIRVKEQQWVKRGQHIASMGSSGTDRVMLHFEIRYKGKSVNPQKYLPKR